MTSIERCFRGLQKTTLLDFPGKVACVLFVGGCSFNCPYCYNCSLVKREEPELTWAAVRDFLAQRRKVLEGVCVSGGEPTLAPFLPAFLGEVRELGLEVKLDTNGYHPEPLKALLDAHLVDFVALDIKNSPAKYAATCGLPAVDLNRIKTSLYLLQASGVTHELRTTVSAGLHDIEDMQEIVSFTGGGARFALQPVQRDAVSLSGRRFVPPTLATLRAMGEILEESFNEVIIHGT
ncbi:MAG: 7-carboxy-7-deazaguanine synthase [Firmicutes bacterium]|nr:7-carboxy-7-deazaguanine synthase [candidate division NPL-UPA2 bacterium]MBT9154668.1 7-carboxy-7-deazaguanine synthase [candidate division NPL-UPA2 bacterium]MBT9155333.1 7-carboxy-7-deazaguanine synthase [candidate division NPL-UPA2 bacterium]